MLLTGAVGALTITARVTGDPLSLMVDHYGAVGGLDFDGLLHQVVRHRVIVLVVLDVVIDMHAGLFDIGILVRLGTSRHEPGSGLANGHRRQLRPSGPSIRNGPAELCL